MTASVVPRTSWLYTPHHRSSTFCRRGRRDCAALGVLTGNGKRVDGEGYLGFDGKYILPNATPVYLHRCR